MYLVGISLLNIDGTNLGYGVNFLAHSLHGVTLLGCHLYSRWCMLLRLFFPPLFECFQNKFYIESKLNRDLREDLMKLFADHIAEKHVNTLMRKCVALFGAFWWLF